MPRGRPRKYPITPTETHLAEPQPYPTAMFERWLHRAQQRPRVVGEVLRAPIEKFQADPGVIRRPSPEEEKHALELLAACKRRRPEPLSEWTDVHEQKARTEASTNSEWRRGKGEGKEQFSIAHD